MFKKILTIFIFILVIIQLSFAQNQSTGSVNRTLDENYLVPNGSINITLTGIGDFNISKFIETIPEIFIVENLTVNGSMTRFFENHYNFIAVGNESSYRITTNSTEYGIYTITGEFWDENRDYGEIPESAITLIDPIYITWDTNNNKYIDKSEILDAVRIGYFSGNLTLSEILKLITSYFNNEKFLL